MRRVLYHISPLLIVLLLTACEKQVYPELEEIEPRLVVDGWIYSEPMPYYVYLSYTDAYFSQDVPPAATGATVYLAENGVWIDTLQEMFPGFYFTNGMWQGQPGNTYQLKIELEGETYDAENTMTEPVAIDYVVPTTEDDSLYSLNLFMQEPAKAGNYYRYQLYRNGLPYIPFMWDFESDELINGQYIAGYELDDHYYLSGDTARLQLLSLNEEQYKFFYDVDEQESSGSLMDERPANPNSNISNGAFGYFGAAGSSSKTVIIP